MTTSAPPQIEKTGAASAQNSASKNGQNGSGANVPKKTLKEKLIGGATLAGKILAWQIVAILVVEFTLACAGLGEEEIFKLDPKFGFVHMNNKRITWRSEGYSKTFFGPDGMREEGLTIQKPAGVFRVALLGDSIVESLQVPFEETFGQILEKQLKKTAEGKDLQILNFGNSGYSTAQEYLQLKHKVMKYSPDAVIVFYNHRDIFENWAPPDQTLTNVRPYALQLQDGKLTIDNSSVTTWMKSPRGRFLTSIDWIREHSRIWGLIAAWETQASFNDPIYRAVMGFLTEPRKSWKGTVAYVKTLTPQSVFDSIAKNFQPGKKSASFNIKFIDEKKSKDKKQEAQPKPADSKDHSKDTLDAAKASYILDAPDLTNFPGNRTKEQQAADAKAKADADAKAKAAADAKAKEAEEAAKGQAVYLDLMFKTLRSLFTEMDKTCKNGGAKLAIVAAPSRLALVEREGENGMMDQTYDKEIAVVKEYCEKTQIPFADMQSDLQALPKKEAAKLFYSMHLTKEGHQYVVKEAQDLFKTLTGASSSQ